MGGQMGWSIGIPQQAELVIGGWHDDGMLMCPSQRWVAVRYKDNWYRLYLRWRWDDPWTGRVNQCPNRKEAEDLFGDEIAESVQLLGNCYEHDDYLLAEQELIQQAIVWIDTQWL
jgi:hypothetical protein